MLTINSLDGTPLALHHLGGEEERVLLIVHATGFSSLVYQQLVRRSSLAKQFSVYGVDLRSHGGSSNPKTFDFAWEHYGEDAAAAARHFSGRPIFGFGHSCGGASLLMADIAHQIPFGGLFLYEPIVMPPELQGPPNNATPLALGASKRRSSFSSLSEARANFSSKAPLQSFDPDVLEDYLSSCFRPTQEGIELCCAREIEAATYARGASHQTYQGLPLVSCPTTVAEGGSSMVFPPGYLEKLTDELPQGHYVKMADAGHFAPMEDPKGFASYLEQWTQRLPAS